MSRETRSRADLIIHPVRLRIIQAFGGGQRLTAQQVAALLPDLPRASLYRHLDKLLAGGVLAVVAERPVRAVQERVYALVETAANVGPAEYGPQQPADHLRYFTAFLELLRGDLARYLLQHPAADLPAEGFAYYQLPLTLSDAEFQQLVATLQAALAPVRAQRPMAGRRRRLLSLIAMPATTTDAGAGGNEGNEGTEGTEGDDESAPNSSPPTTP